MSECCIFQTAKFWDTHVTSCLNTHSVNTIGYRTEWKYVCTYICTFLSDLTYMLKHTNDWQKTYWGQYLYTYAQYLPTKCYLTVVTGHSSHIWPGKNQDIRRVFFSLIPSRLFQLMWNQGHPRKLLSHPTCWKFLTSFVLKINWPIKLDSVRKLNWFHFACNENFK
jgi:hypothetical protein